MEDRVLVNGMMWGSGRPIVPPQGYQQFKEDLLRGLLKPKEKPLASVAVSCKRFSFLRAHFESIALPNLNNPLEVGWALLLPEEEPEAREIANALTSLVRHRKGKIIYAKPDEKWIETEYTFKPDSERQYYILLAGPPSKIPFNFQYLLDTHAAVGRVAFDRLEDYESYANKVVNYETSPSIGVERHAVVFATAHNEADATYFSKTYMADALVKLIEGKNIPVTYLAGENATLRNFLSTTGRNIIGPSPALVYTASHGLAVPGGSQNEALRRKLQGAICCQDYDGTKGVFSAECIPSDQFLYGSIVFTFACYGAGTPKRSDFFHWIPQPSLLDCCPQEDFVAALPSRLLANPKGPLAFFGHIDPAWLLSFTDPKRGFGTRMTSFTQAVEQLLDGYTIGYAVKRFNEVYTHCNSRLAAKEDEFRANKALDGDERWTNDLVELWITRNDSQNYIILGDPAVRVKYIQ